MKRTSHLNLKWTMADVDRIVSLAKGLFTASEIAAKFPGTSADEIERVCADAGQFVRTIRRVS